jgi:hypothetical protein
MSKMDAQRAMREARYEQRAAAATRPAARRAEQRAPKPAEVEPPVADPEGPEVLLCGHKAISGRTCTRERGHSAKSHRYS